MRVWPLLLVLLCGCSPATAGLQPTSAADGDEPVATAEKFGPTRPRVIVGERFEAHMRVAGLLAGTLETVVQPPCDLAGTTVIPVTSNSHSAGLIGLIKKGETDITSWLEAASALPRAGDTVVNGKDGRRQVVVRYDEALPRPKQVEPPKPPPLRNGKIRAPKPEPRPTIHTAYTRETPAGQRTSRGRTRLPVGQVAHDLHTAFLALRQWNAEPGSRGELYVMVGRRMWRIEVEMIGADTVWTEEGSYDAVRIDGIGQKLDSRLEPAPGEPRPFSLWLADAPGRMPLKAVAEADGLSLEIELVDYTVTPAPNGAIEPCRNVPADALRPPDPPKKPRKPFKKPKRKKPTRRSVPREAPRLKLPESWFPRPAAPDDDPYADP